MPPAATLHWLCLYFQPLHWRWSDLNHCASIVIHNDYGRKCIKRMHAIKATHAQWNIIKVNVLIMLSFCWHCVREMIIFFSTTMDVGSGDAQGAAAPPAIKHFKNPLQNNYNFISLFCRILFVSSIWLWKDKTFILVLRLLLLYLQNVGVAIGSETRFGQTFKYSWIKKNHKGQKRKSFSTTTIYI